MRSSKRILTGLLTGSLLAWAGVEMLQRGILGLSLFVVSPILLGGLAAWMFPPSSIRGAAGRGALASVAALTAVVLFRLDGLLCALMALPLALPLSVAGAVFVHLVDFSQRASRTTGMLLLLPISIGWDIHAQPPVMEVRTAIEIDAAPEQVWPNVVAFSELPEPAEWWFLTGLAYPKRARIEGSGPGAVRYCEFSTGAFVEPIEQWQPPNLLQFRVTENPAPMQEWGPFGSVDPKHLHGYLVAQRGQFELTRLDGDRTRLTGSTWYRHGLWPAEYWRWWSDAIIHRIHLRVLHHIRALSE